MKGANSDVAYAYIRKRIIGGEFPPGAPLMANILSEEIGVSRTPVRDALRLLEVDGLVTIKPRLGASVKKMDLREFRDLCELRLALESHAAGLAARNRTEADLREMRLALERMRGLVEKIAATGNEQQHWGDLVREDVRFHVAVIAAAQNHIMKAEILRFHVINRVVSGPTPGEPNQQLTPAEREERRRMVLAQHEAILSAIEKSDEAKAKAAMDRHINGIIVLNLQVLSRTTSGYIARPLTEQEMIYSV